MSAPDDAGRDLRAGSDRPGTAGRELRAGYDGLDATGRVERDRVSDTHSRSTPPASSAPPDPARGTGTAASGPSDPARGTGTAASDFVFATIEYESGDWDSAPLVPANLIDTLARYTSLRVAPSGVVVPLASEALLRHPFAYLTGHLPVRFTEAERRNLKTWIDRGGFLFVDDHNHDVDGMFHKTCTEELARTLGPLVELPNDHALYSAFFKFGDGPPTTSHELNGWGDNLVHKHLLAVMRGDRIAVLYSNKDYSSEWGYHPDNKRFQSVDNTRFAVNIVTYALTR